MNNQSTDLLLPYGIVCSRVLRNSHPAILYEESLTYESDSAVSETGALIVSSSEKTGRSPKDKRIVMTPEQIDDIWWGDINIGIDEDTFMIVRERALDYLNICETLYVTDAFAGWDPKYRIKVRVIASRPYHALFMHNMLIRPSKGQLVDFGELEYVIFNAGRFPANPSHQAYEFAHQRGFKFQAWRIRDSGYRIRGRDEKRRFHHHELHHAQTRHIVDAQFRKRR